MTPNGDLDLDVGEPDTPAARRRRRRDQRAGAEETKRKDASTVTDSELRNQLNRAFNGIAQNRIKRGDEELATAIEEESDAMTEGFVTLTDIGPLKTLRLVLIIVLNLVITLLAFGRVGGILLTRIAERRQRRAAEAAAAAGDESLIVDE